MTSHFLLYFLGLLYMLPLSARLRPSRWLTSRCWIKVALIFYHCPQLMRLLAQLRGWGLRFHQSHCKIFCQRFRIWFSIGLCSCIAVAAWTPGLVIRQMSSIKLPHWSQELYQPAKWKEGLFKEEVYFQKNNMKLGESGQNLKELEEEICSSKISSC